MLYCKLCSGGFENYPSGRHEAGARTGIDKGKSITAMPQVKSVKGPVINGQEGQNQVQVRLT